MKKINRFLVILALFTVGLFITNCSSSPGVEPPEPKPEITPKISLESISTSETSASFFVTLADAGACSYHYFEKTQGSATNPTAEEIFKDGTSLSSMESQMVTIKNLTADTEYTVVAAAKNESGKVVVTAVAITLKTQAAGQVSDPKIMITAGTVTNTTLSFTIIPTDAESCAYHYFETPKEGAVPVLTGKEIFDSGTTLSGLDPQVITLEGLIEGQEYIITAAITDAKGNYITVKDQLVMTTTGESYKMDVVISDVSATYDAITYTITPTSAARLAYDVYEKTPDYEHPNPRIIFYGRELENILTPSTVTWDNLRDNTTYYIYAAVESGEGLYNREMDYKEVTTATRPDPDDMPEQFFTTGRLETYFDGRNYIIYTENAEYSMVLDLYGSLVPPSRPMIEQHEYTFSHTFSTKDTWVATNLTKIIDKSTSTPLQIEKGSVTVAYSGDIYTVTGGLVMKDNKKFLLDYTGQLTYPVKDMKTGQLEVVDSKNVLSMKGTETAPYSLRLDFSDTQPIIGSHTVGTTILTTSTLLGLDGTNYTFASGVLTIKEPSKDLLSITGDIVLNNGDRISLNLVNVNVSIPVPPANIEITYTTATASGFSDSDDPWGFNIYELTMRNDDGETFIEFGSLSGTAHAVPPGNYYYKAGSGDVSDGGVGILKVKSTKHGDLTRAIDDGKMVITKSGTTYTVTMDMEVSGLGNIVAFKATYEGEIPCAGTIY